MKHHSPTGRRNHGRPLKRLLDTWDRKALTSDPTPWQIWWWWWWWWHVTNYVKDYNVSRKLIIAGCTDGILFTGWYIPCWVWWRCKGLTCWNRTPFLKCRDEIVLHWLHKPYRAEVADQNYILADSSLHQEVSLEHGTLSTQRVS
jgi:hypothetical protein